MLASGCGEAKTLVSQQEYPHAMSDLKPVCFVVMPFGEKKNPANGAMVDFDHIYREGIEAGIREADLDPVRADGEVSGGIIHKPMFERLILCDYVVADLTTANANVFYELGIRHAVRPRTTLPIFACSQLPPFDVGFLRGLPYELGSDNSMNAVQAEALKTALAKRLKDLRRYADEGGEADSPIFQLLDFQPGRLEHEKTDEFRRAIENTKGIQERLKAARALGGERGFEATVGIREALGDLADVEASITTDIFLSFRALSRFEEMIQLVEDMPPELKRSVMIREQLAFALNRNAKRVPEHRARAAGILKDVISERGANSESCGLLGRIYKDLWEEAAEKGKKMEAMGHLRKAIETYTAGFEADCRDAFPGINAVTLLEVEGSAESVRQRDRLLPVVRFSVEQRLRGTPDYWDHATLLELAVLGEDTSSAAAHLPDCLANVREVFEPETTARNLKLIADARRARNGSVAWIEDAIAALLAKRDDLSRGTR